MQSGKKWARRLAAALFLLCAVGFVWLLSLECTPQQQPLWLEPGGGLPAFDCEGPLELSYTLPAWNRPLRPLLEVRSLSAAADLRLDGTPLAHFPAGLGSACITLPDGFTGSSLTLSLVKAAGDPLPSLRLTDFLLLDADVRADACRFAFPAAAFGVLALLSLGLALYGGLEGPRPWPVPLLGLAAFAQAAYFYLQNIPSFSWPPVLYGLALCLSRALLAAAPPLYLLHGMRRRQKHFAPFALLPALAYFFVAGFQTAIPAFSDIAAYIGCVFAFTYAVFFPCAALEFRDGNPMFRRFLPWLAACAAGIALLCAVSLLRTGALPPALIWALSELAALRPDSALFYGNSLLLVLCFLDSVAALVQRTAARETEIQALSFRESLAREHLAAVQESAAALGGLRHEVKNHYLVLQSLHRAGEGERLDAYLDGLLAEAAAIPSMACAPHPAVNAVLTTMLARAQKQGITTEHRVDIPETLPFPDTALCTVLMNLLQNALDANALAPEGAQKWLRVNLHTRGMHLYIGVENARFAPVDYDDISGLCRTTKPAPSAHGYGLKAVQAVARKYHSELVLRFPEGRFSAATALQMPD